MGGGKNPLAGRARGTKDPPPGAETPHPGQHEATASQLVSGLCLLHRSRGDPHHGGDQPQHPLLGHGDPGRRQTPTHPPLPANASPPGPPIWGVTAKLPSRRPSSRHGLGCRNPTSPQQAVTTRTDGPGSWQSIPAAFPPPPSPPGQPQVTHLGFGFKSSQSFYQPDGKPACIHTHTHTHTLACCKHGLCRACNLSSHLVPSLPPY